jgi:hypothetical protein
MIKCALSLALLLPVKTAATAGGEALVSRIFRNGQHDRKW